MATMPLGTGAELSTRQRAASTITFCRKRPAWEAAEAGQRTEDMMPEWVVS